MNTSTLIAHTASRALRIALGLLAAVTLMAPAAHAEGNGAGTMPRGEVQPQPTDKTGSAQAASTAAPGLSQAELDAMVQTVVQAAAAKLKLGPGALRLAPDQPRHSGDWVFLTGRLLNAAGQPFDYAGTSLQEAAQAGTVSDTCAALLRREGGVWKLVEIAVGPTDVAWEPWPVKHKAPASLFK